MQLMLFTNNVQLACAAYNAKIDRIVIDLERRGKSERQHGYHLELNNHVVEDISRIKLAVPITVMCRLNALYQGTHEEIESALDAGADILMLPMFEKLEEAEQFLEKTRQRARTSLLFETLTAIEQNHKFQNLNVDEVYVGLNDLGLSYKSAFQYQLLAEGIVDKVRNNFPKKNFGFGGITILGEGQPLSTRNIIRELARLGANQVFVRRAFKRDIEGKDMTIEVKRLKQFYVECLSRTVNQAEADRQTIVQIINTIEKKLK